MRFVLIVATLALGLVALGGAKAQTELRASVDLSEWTPSQRLVLNLTTGSYVVSPPTEGWPAYRARPVERRGRLVGEDLRVTRALAKQAFKRGLTDKKCEARQGSAEDLVLTNAVGPMELVLTDGHRVQRSAQTKCRTQAANDLFGYITRLFDPRSP